MHWWSYLTTLGKMAMTIGSAFQGACEGNPSHDVDFPDNGTTAGAPLHWWSHSYHSWQAFFMKWNIEMTQVIPLAAFLEGNEHPVIFEHVILDSANGDCSQLRRDSLLQCSLERSDPQQIFYNLLEVIATFAGVVALRYLIWQPAYLTGM